MFKEADFVGAFGAHQLVLQQGIVLTLMKSVLFVVPSKMMPTFSSIVSYQELYGLQLTLHLEQTTFHMTKMVYNSYFILFYQLPLLIILSTKLSSLYGTCGKRGMTTDSIETHGPLGRSIMQYRHICPLCQWLQTITLLQLLTHQMTSMIKVGHPNRAIQNLLKATFRN